MTAILESLSEEFDNHCTHRLVEGAKEYGAVAFLKHPALPEMILEEIIDTANWAKMLYMKMRFVQIQIERLENEVRPNRADQSSGEGGEPGLPLGASAFDEELPNIY